MTSRKSGNRFAGIAWVLFFTVLMAGSLGCDSSTDVGSTAPKKAVAGKWREVKSDSFEILNFRKGELTITRIHSYRGGKLPDKGGAVFEYSFPETNTLQLSSTSGKQDLPVRVLSKNLIEITSGQYGSTLYVRWSDQAENSIKGSYYFRKKKYSQALPLLEKAAESGELDAQYVLSTMYFQGNGVEKSSKTAMEWAKKSADANFGKALGLLGDIYESANDGEQDYGNAIAAYEKAVELGAGKAEQQIKLLWLYATAPEKYRDGEKALALAREAEGSRFRMIKSLDKNRILAAAHAAGNDFATAVKYQKKLIKQLGSSKKPQYVQLRREAKIVLDSLYAKNLPYSVVEGAKITKRVEQEMAAEAREAARIAALTKKATTPTETLGALVFPKNPYKGEFSDTQVTITNVGMVIRKGSRTREVFFKDICSIITEKKARKIRKRGKRVNIAYATISFSPSKGNIYSGFRLESSEDKIKQLYEKCLPAVVAWRKAYSDLASADFKTANNL